MVYTVSVLRSTPKSAPVLHKIIEILADHYEVYASGSVRFFNVERHWLYKDRLTEVAFLPPHTWVIT